MRNILVISIILFFQTPNQLIGQISTYSRWTDSMEMTISNEDQHILDNDTSIFSIKIDLFGHSMILFKTNLNNYHGYCFDYIFQFKKEIYRTVYIKTIVNADTVKALIDYYIDNQIDTLISLDEIDILHNYVSITKDGDEYTVTTKSAGFSKVIKFDYPEEREYHDKKLEKLIEFKKVIVKYGNWENRKKELMHNKFEKGCYRINGTTTKGDIGEDCD